MATGVNGYLPTYYQYNAYYEAKYGGMYITPHYTEEYYADGNYSIVKIDHINFTSSMYSQTVSWSISGKININGVDYSYSGSVNTASYTATSWSCSIVSDPIYHNSDGSKAITISLTSAACSSGQVGAQWSNTGTLSSASVTLTTIPLASTITATDANIGAVSQITVTRKSTNYTHSIYYHFGNLTGYITSSGDISDAEVTFSNTSIGWTIPTSFYTQIPNDKTGYGSLHIKTYSGSTQIGDTKTTTFTVTAAEALCSPTVSGTVVDVNEATIALTGSADILVRYMSDALCTISTEAKNSATVSSKTIAGVTVTENTRTIVGIETDTVAFGVTDSRGYSNSADVTKYFVPYIKLTNNSTAERPDPTSGKVTLIIKGSCFNGNFGAADNTVTATYSIDGETPVAAAVTMSGNSYSVTLNLTGFDYQSSYSIEVVVSDKLMTVSKTLPIQKGIPVFDWGEDDFNFNVPVSFGDKGTTARNLMSHGITNGDFDTIIDQGVYWMQLASCTNGPGTSGFGFLEVANAFPWAASGVLQRFTYYNTLKTYIRSYMNSAWTTWTHVSQNSDDIFANNYLIAGYGIDLGTTIPSGSGHGGHIDFHYDGNTASDFTSRIIESSSGRLHIEAPNGLSINTNMMMAYVIAYGWYDGWYYRKWSNGRAEVWGDLWYSGASSNGWVYFNKAYPFPFTANPRVVYSTVSQSVYDHWIGQTSLGPTQFNGVKLFCNSNEKVGGCIMVYAYGEWY